MSSPKSSPKVINASWKNVMKSHDPWIRMTQGKITNVLPIPMEMKDAHYPEERLALLAATPFPRGEKRYIWRALSSLGIQILIVTATSGQPPSVDPKVNDTVLDVVKGEEGGVITAAQIYDLAARFKFFLNVKSPSPGVVFNIDESEDQATTVELNRRQELMQDPRFT